MSCRRRSGALASPPAGAPVIAPVFASVAAAVAATIAATVAALAVDALLLVLGAGALLGAQGADALGAVPDAVRRLPWRREVLPPGEDTTLRGADDAAGATQTWWLVTVDSLVAPLTRGDLAAVRLVDAEGGPVPAVVLEPTAADVHARPVDLPPSAWRQQPDDPRVLEVEFDLPPGGALVVEWESGALELVGVHALRPDGSWGAAEGADPDRWAHAGSGAPGRERAAYELPESRARIVVKLRRPDPSPQIRCERLTERSELRRAVPLAPRSGVFRGTTYEQVIDLPGGPRAVASVTIARRDDATRGAVTLELQDADGRWQGLPLLPLPRHSRARGSRPVVRSTVAPDDPSGRSEGEASAQPGLWDGTHEERLEVRGRPTLACAIRLRYEAADPPIVPFEVTAVIEVPPALAFVPAAPRPIWLVYGEHPVAEPPTLPRERLRSVPALRIARLGPVGANPWFRETPLGATWLQRRPLVVTLAMVIILAVVAWLVVAERGPKRAPDVEADRRARRDA